MSRWVHAWREALVLAMIPEPGGGLPALAALDRRDFWGRFDAAAPIHLHLGLALAAVVLVSVLPRLGGHVRSLGALGREDQDRLLRRAAGWPGTRDLLDVAKIVACFAYFDDELVQARARGEGR